VKVESLIATAIRLLEDGRIVNLAALQGRTKQVCDAALALPRAESRTLVPAMEALLTALDTLAAKLNDRFGDLPSLSGHVGADAAASAYGQSLKHFP
jgi:hypothetical protein